MTEVGRLQGFSGFPTSVFARRGIFTKRNSKTNSATAPDLESLSKADLEALQRQVEGALAKSEARRKQDAIDAVKRAVEENGFTFEEFLAVAAEKKPKKTSRRAGDTGAKFRNPANPDETWSGRGRRPAWFNAQLEAGKSEDDLRA